MKHFPTILLIGLVLSLIMTGISSAEESSGILVYLQGKSSSIEEGQNGSLLITIQDPVPYYHLALREKSFLRPVETFVLQNVPVNAALVFNRPDGESVSLVEISGISVPDGNKSLKLQVKGLDFYEGELLGGFTSSGTKLKDQVVNSTGIGIYMEIPAAAPENSQSNWTRERDKTNPYCILHPDEC